MVDDRLADLADVLSGSGLAGCEVVDSDAQVVLRGVEVSSGGVGVFELNQAPCEVGCNGSKREIELQRVTSIYM